MHKHLLLSLAATCSLAATAAAATITVTTVADDLTANDGSVSVREAISAINAGYDLGDPNIIAQNPGTFGTADRINFNIPGSGVRTIVLATVLPQINKPITIDGYTQPASSANTLAIGDNAVLLIELNGSSTSGSGLTLGGVNGGSTVRGLVINRFVGDFSDAAIRVISGGNVVAGCFIGVDASGTTKLANGNGVRFVTGANNLLGGTVPAARNVLSGNNASTSSSGGSSNVSIAFDGAYPPSVPLPTGTVIRGNYIGTNAAGTAGISDAATFGATDGLLIGGGTGTIVGGTDSDDGKLDGIVGARNVISGNFVGISTRFGIYDGDVTIQGNFIGTDASGSAAIGNYSEAINFNPYPYDGSRFTANSLTIGGTGAGAGNVISGTIYGSGITTNARKVIVQGNRIGTDVTGTAALGNAGNLEAAIYLTSPFPSYPGSVVTIGGASAAARNIISGNGTSGITSFESRTASRFLSIQGNFIGTQSDGQTALGNGGNGIFVLGPATIGGTNSGEGNVIAYNGTSAQVDRGSGVVIPSSFSGIGPFGISILGNSIFANRGLGIDLGGAPDTGGGDGPTKNDLGDGDAGPNNLQNFPVLTSTHSSPGSMNVVGTLNSLPSTSYRLEFFGNTTLDPSLYGEGRTYLGFTNVTTDPIGNAAFDAPVAPAAHVTATATDPAGNTSEFSQTNGQLLNISTRLRVRTGDNVLIGGFIVTGTDPKRILLRGLGPSLGSQTGNALLNPTLELHGPNGETLATNDNWKVNDLTQQSQEEDIRATSIPPTDDRESAILATLPANNAFYTAIVRGKDDSSGIGLVEAYDLDQAANSQLANVSTRGFVETQDNVLIGGFIVGNGTSRVIVRALGPSLEKLGVASPLQDPTLTVRDSNGSVALANNDWQQTQRTEIEATGIPPSDPRESAIVATLRPDGYTAVVRGVNDTVGVALVEVYALP